MMTPIQTTLDGKHSDNHNMYFSIARGEKMPPCSAIVETRGTEGFGSVGDKKSVGSSRRLPRNWKSEHLKVTSTSCHFQSLKELPLLFNYTDLQTESFGEDENENKRVQEY